MNVEAIRQLVEGAIPYASKTGVKLVEAAPYRVVLALPPDPTNNNHVGSYHAGALFTFGETAGGAALLVSFDLSSVRLLAKSAQIRYKRLVTDTITCTVELAREQVASLMDEVARNGRATFSLPLSFIDQAGEVAAEMTVEYHLKKLA